MFRRSLLPLLGLSAALLVAIAVIAPINVSTRTTCSGNNACAIQETISGGIITGRCAVLGCSGTNDSACTKTVCQETPPHAETAPTS